MSKILVTGATGEYGKATINFLLQKGASPSDISAFVRDENKASEFKSKGIKIIKGDYNDYDSLVNAFKGVDKILFISANDLNLRNAQHSNVISAAKESQVKHVIYTSVERKIEDGTSPLNFLEESHLNTEKWLKESGIPYTILRNNLYFDVIPNFIGDKVLETGIVYIPAQNGNAAFVLRSDMAEASANILLSDGHEGKEYSFSNIEIYSFSDVAKLISEFTGKQISYVSPSVEEYKNTLTGAGVPEEFINVLVGFAQVIAIGEFDNTSTDLENLLGRKPTTLKEFIQRVYSK